MSERIKSYFWTGFISAAFLSLFAGYLIGAAIVIAVAALDAFSVITLAKAEEKYALKGFAAATAGAIAAVATSYTASLFYRLLT